MANKRENYTPTENSILYAETGGGCPLCTQPIVFQKKSSNKPTKCYEIAHIYPLNPTPSQVVALVGYPVPPDINVLENLIALCPTCHTKYDKDFKIEELTKLRKIKDGYLGNTKAKLTASQHTIQEEVFEILDAIASYEFDETALSPTKFDITTVDKKLKTGMSPFHYTQLELHKLTS